MSKKILYGLQPWEYEHPLDKKALDALEGTPGFETLVKKFWKYGLEKLMKVQYTGSNIKVSNENYPDIYSVLEEACEIINLPKIPDLYLSWSYNLNAMTIGVVNPIIVIFSGCIDLLNREELLFIIGHELGHIKSNHILYHQIGDILPILSNIISPATLGIGGILSVGLELALLNWQRMSEFTADRAGLLVCQDPEVATSTMIKISGLPKKYYNKFDINDFIKQSKKFKDFDLNLMDKTAKYISIMWKDHPWTVMRGAEFFDWINSGEYQTIIEKHSEPLNKLPENKKSTEYCPNCGNIINTNDKFCSKCGIKLQISFLSDSDLLAYIKEKSRLPKFVKCPKCGEELKLNEDEQRMLKYICPSCNERIDYSVYLK